MMKNFAKIFTAVVVALVAYACTTDTTETLGVKLGGQTTLTLSIEESRTQLGEKVDGVYPVKWCEDDVVAANGVKSTAIEILSDGSAAQFTFAEDVARPYSLVYPASEATPVTAGLQAVTFLASQAYVAGSFCDGAAPMYGYADEGDENAPIQLQHLTGVLRLAVKGNGEVLKSIAVVAEGKIAGNFDVDCQTGALTAHEDASNTVNVTFEEELTLGAEAAPIYVAVPAGEHGGITLTLTTADAKCMTLFFNSNGERAIKAATVREFAELTFEENDPASDWFEIYTVADMLTFAKNAASFPFVGAKLMATIDMTDVEWTPIEGFSKIFDGNKDADCKIVGLSAPLFGTTTATIKNLDLNVNIATHDAKYYDATTEAMSLGGLACIAGGPISNCVISGSVNWDATASEYSYTFVAGVVAWAQEGASFTDVENKAAVVTEKDNNTTFLGGICAMSGTSGGEYTVTFTSCTNSGAISVAKDEGTGQTNRNSYVGGIVGSNWTNMTITLCNNTGTVSHYDNYTKNCYIGGIFGCQFAQVATSINNCTNGGAIYSNTNCRENSYIGGVFGCLKTKGDNLDLSNLTNNGTVTIEGQNINRSIYAGGVAGYLNHGNSSALSISNWFNTNTLTMNAGGNYRYLYDETKSAYNLRMGGVFGEINVEKGVGIDNFDNSGTVIYGSDAVFYGTVSTNPDMFIGGVGGYKVFGSISNCDNSGDIYLRAANANYHHHVGGVFGQSNSYALETKNCNNLGDIFVESTFETKRFRIGGLWGNLYCSVVNDCVNTGNITLNQQEKGNQLFLGGCIGYGYSRKDNDYFQVAGLENSGKITVNKAVADDGAQICIAGIVASAQKLYGDTAYIKDCVNIGDIEVNLSTRFTAINIAGIMAHCNTTNANISYSGHKQHSDIKAIGFGGKVGMIEGIARADATKAANCEVGGNLILAETTTPGAWDDNLGDYGPSTTTNVLTPITESNWFEYIYKEAVTEEVATGDGCAFLATKPVVNAPTIE